MLVFKSHISKTCYRRCIWFRLTQKMYVSWKKLLYLKLKSVVERAPLLLMCHRTDLAQDDQSQRRTGDWRQREPIEKQLGGVTNLFWVLLSDLGQVFMVVWSCVCQENLKISTEIGLFHAQKGVFESFLRTWAARYGQNMIVLLQIVIAIALSLSSLFWN